MQRWTALAFVGFVALAVAATILGSQMPPGPSPAPSASAPVLALADAGPPAPAPIDAGRAAAPSDAGAVPDDPGSPIDSPLNVQSDAGLMMLTGDAPPALGGDAPKAVSFGVILIQYRGSQGAPPNVRSREEALTLAKQIAEEAKTDFKAAVAKGDKGSGENMGKIARGFLEPAPEYVLFSLSKDGVSDPVDTPRGFWIVKRND